MTTTQGATSSAQSKNGKTTHNVVTKVEAANTPSNPVGPSSNYSGPASPGVRPHDAAAYKDPQRVSVRHGEKHSADRKAEQGRASLTFKDAMRCIARTTDPEAELAAMALGELSKAETDLESLLHRVRAQKQKRLERQLWSAERRHAQESRGRQDLEDEQACVICSDAPRGILFLPCRHLCACPECSPVLASCPICRVPIARQVECIRS
mmetsp:Transcript_8643/g.20343  ORF Transcript_8643/g.20343 Transcript_8643/m.20343 type:complete len:209 (+) Transcript_8643:3-629(+)